MVPQHQVLRGIGMGELDVVHTIENIEYPTGNGGILTHKNKQTMLIFDIQQSNCLPKSISQVLSWSPSCLDVERDITLHNLVVSSGCYNFEGLRIPVVSNLNEHSLVEREFERL